MQRSASASAPIRIGIVDADRSFAADLGAALEAELGATVDWVVSDLASARDSMRTDPVVNLAIVNFALPDGLGLTLIQDATSLRIPVVMVTDWDRPIYAEEARRRGAVATLRKDLPTGDIVAIVGVLLGR